MIQTPATSDCRGTVCGAGLRGLGNDHYSGKLDQLQQPCSLSRSHSPGLPMESRPDPPAEWGGQSSPLTFPMEGSLGNAHAFEQEQPKPAEQTDSDFFSLPELTPSPDRWHPQLGTGSLSPLRSSRSPKREREELGVLESPPVEDQCGDPRSAPPPRRARSSTWQSTPSSPILRQGVAELLEWPLSLDDALPARPAHGDSDGRAILKSAPVAAFQLVKGDSPNLKADHTHVHAGQSPLDQKRVVPVGWGPCGRDPEPELRAVPLEPVAQPPTCPVAVAVGVSPRAAVEEEVRRAALELKRAGQGETPLTTVHASVAWPWKQSKFVREPVPVLACETAAEVASAAFQLFQITCAAQVRVVWMEESSSGARVPGAKPSGGIAAACVDAPAVPFIQLNPFGAEDVDRAIAREVEGQAFVVGKGGKRSRTKMCTVCNSAKSNLSRHLREHMGIMHVCAMPRCGRVFRGGVRGNLVPHAKEHLPGLC